LHLDRKSVTGQKKCDVWTHRHTDGQTTEKLSLSVTSAYSRPLRWHKKQRALLFF